MIITKALVALIKLILSLFNFGFYEDEYYDGEHYDEEYLSGD